MLRHYDQHGGGVKNCTHYLLRELFNLNSEHEFILIYRDPRHIGTYSNGKNVREVAFRSPSIFLWDQIAVRWAEKREKIDLIFNPKYSIPITAGCRTVFVAHGFYWYLMPWGSKWVDRLSHRYLVPRYAKKSDAIISVSNTTKETIIKYLDIDPDKVHTVYLGVHEAFLDRVSDDKREEVRRQYGLPDRFFLYCGQIYPPKNFGRLLKAYASVGPKRGIYLVVAGEHRWLCQEELKLIDTLGLKPWVMKVGWVDHHELPGFYHLAESLLLPSLYEACPSPILEAMACGCPIVTANRYGTRELAGDAAVLVDPEDVASIEEGMVRVLDDGDFRDRLTQAGFARVQSFSWEKCARETMRVLEDTM
jgi:glycosyltransferase involved in cell wall biosynthesis